MLRASHTRDLVSAEEKAQAAAAEAAGAQEKSNVASDRARAMEEEANTKLVRIRVLPINFLLPLQFQFTSLLHTTYFTQCFLNQRSDSMEAQFIS